MPYHTRQILIPAWFLPSLHYHHGATRFTMSFVSASKFRQLSYFAFPQSLRYIILLEEGVESNPRSLWMSEKQLCSTIVCCCSIKRQYQIEAALPSISSEQLLTNCHQTFPAYSTADEPMTESMWLSDPDTRTIKITVDIHSPSLFSCI